jgi:hypothetical protein
VNWSGPFANATFVSDVANTTLGSKGAGLVGFNNTLTYTAGTVGAWLRSLATSAGAGLIGWVQSGTGAVLRFVQEKLRERASPLDFGAVGDGVADDTAACTALFAAKKHISIPAGYTFLIKSTLTAQAGTRIETKGGDGNTTGSLPASYFIKHSSMTTPAIKLIDRCMMDGGGVVCQVGNTGDAIVGAGNGIRIINVFQCLSGGVGIRLGDSSGTNTNSFIIRNCTSINSVGDNFYIHDGTAASGANCNQGILDSCVGDLSTGGDGFHLGHCFWVRLVNCLGAGNAGYGYRLSGTTNNSVPECRWVSVEGGDFNEGNTLGQCFDQSYCSQMFNPDPNNIPSNAGTGVPGSGLRNIISSLGASVLNGLTIKASASSYPLTVDDGAAGTMSYPSILKKTTTGGNGQGVGLSATINDGTTTYVNAGSIRFEQATVGQFNVVLSGFKAAAQLDILKLNVNALSVFPAQDVTWANGLATARWTQTFTGNVVLSTAAVSGGAGTVVVGGTTATTVGAAGGASALPATPLGYIIINVAGTQAKVPYFNT